jgi:hypothetical protein
MATPGLERDGTAIVRNENITRQTIQALFIVTDPPWFRLSVKPELQKALLDPTILSKQKYSRLYGHLLSDLSSDLKRHP